MFAILLALLGILLILGVGLNLADMNLRDALLKITRALPEDDSAVTSDAIDTGKSTTQGRQLANVDFLLSAPALTTAQLGDAATMTYKAIHSDNADLSEASDLYPSLIIQTGADGAGAAAATKRFRLPTDAKRYVGFVATNSADVDASGASATLEVLA